MIYLDTSAFLKLYILEADSCLVQDLVITQQDPLPVFEFQQFEFINALHLKAFWKDIATDEIDQLIQLFNKRMRRGQYFCPLIDRTELMMTFCSLARWTTDIGCRTMDILHVACALQISPTLFVTFDRRQERLARKAGLNVHSF